TERRDVARETPLRLRWPPPSSVTGARGSPHADREASLRLNALKRHRNGPTEPIAARSLRQAPRAGSATACEPAFPGERPARELRGAADCALRQRDVEVTSHDECGRCE